MTELSKTKFWRFARSAFAVAFLLVPLRAFSYDLDAAPSCPSGACLSETANNNTAASPNGWPSGTYPNQVEPISRETLASVQRFWNRINGNVTVGGTANAITITTLNDLYPGSYVAGEQICFKAIYANTDAVTVNLNFLGTVNLFKQSASGPVALSGTEIQAKQLVCIAYDGTEYQLMGGASTGTATLPGGSSGQLQINASGAFGGMPAVNGDGTLDTSTGALVVTETNGVSFAPSATTDATNASNVNTGTLPAAQLPLATSSAVGGVKVDGTTITASSGTISAHSSGFTSQNVVTGSRIYGNTYQNTTGKTMYITSVCNACSQLSAVTDSNSSPTTIVNNEMTSVSFMVLNNNYYKINSTGSSTVTSWIEWE